jgi:hypothetical protein
VGQHAALSAQGIQRQDFAAATCTAVAVLLSSDSSNSNSCSSSSGSRLSVCLQAMQPFYKNYSRYPTCFRMLLMSTSFSCSLYELVSGMLLAPLPARHTWCRLAARGTSRAELVNGLMLLNCCMAAMRQWRKDLSEQCRQKIRQKASTRTGP